MALEELEFGQLGDAVVAEVKGEVDISNADSVMARLLDAVPNTASALVLDLSEVGYLDSSGVRQELELVVPDDSMIRRVLLLTEVQRVVPISTSVDAALSG